MAAEESMPPTTRSDTRFTVEDFMLFPDDGKRHEIIDGEHFVTPSPNVRHQRLVQALHLALAEHLRDHPEQGEAFIAPLDVVLSRHDVVEPDLLVVAGHQRGILTDKNIQGPPVLIGEVLSESTRRHDERTKRRLFERTGVREYWLVDPEIDVVRICRRSEDDRLALDAQRGASYATSSASRD